MTYKKREKILYAAVLCGVLVVTLFLPMMDVLRGDSSAHVLLAVLAELMPFILLFLANNFLADRLLRKSTMAYLLGAVLLLVIFFLYCYHWGGTVPGMDPPPGVPPPPKMSADSHIDYIERLEGVRRPMRPEISKFILGVLIVLTNLGCKAYFELLQKEADNAVLQQENIRARLESLRRQINPHFLMNTLNNIQVLTLTDPEKATRSIQELSRLLQVVIYEGDEVVIPLADEVSFLKNFVSLMKLRYTENIDIRTDFPDQMVDAFVPPMVMETFVENAFKHGVSHDAPSYIHVEVKVEDGRVVGSCRNSLHPGKDSDQKGGIGLDNIKKRLDIIYGEDYKLDIDEKPDSFDVYMDIPSTVNTDRL